MLILGGVRLLNCATVYVAVALLARRLLRSRPRTSVVVAKVSGIAVTLIGAGLLIERIVELL
jgi:threonine/homoserine/homoserine lactone efflux protein